MIYNRFEQFLDHRQSLLVQYRQGDLSKNEFIDENYYYIENLGIKPFERVDNVKKAVYNYHYFNIMAKYYQRTANRLPKSDKIRREYINESYYYYHLKEKVTLMLLKLIDFKGVHAYYVIVKSLKLKNKLFEIVITNSEVTMELNRFFDDNNTMECNDLILHSKSPVILNALKENGVFVDERKKSLTDNYINQKY